MSQAGGNSGSGGGGGGTADIQKINVQTGTSPVVTANNTITFNGAVVAAGTHPVRTDGTAPATMALEVQTAQAIASTDATKIGLAAFNSADFSVDANGFVSTTGSGSGIVTIDGNTGSVTGSTVTIETPASTGTLNFSGSGTTLTLNLMDGSGDLAIGNGATATGGNSVVLGTSATDGGGTANVIIGSSAQTTSGNSVVIGNSTNGGSSGEVVVIGAGSSAATSGSTVVIGRSITDHGPGGSVLVGAHANGPSGGFTIAMGYQASSSNSSGANNITIGNAGSSGESNVIRIGTQGGGTGQQNECFIAGIASVSVSNTNMVTIDTTTGQLGSQAVPSGSGIVTIDGNTGSVTGSTVTITTPGSNAQGTANFSGSGTTLTWSPSDSFSNVAFGNGAGASLTSGSNYNVALGLGALTSNTNGIEEIAIGHNALASLTNASNANDNIAIGSSSMGSLVGNAGTSNSNSAIGQLSLTSLTAGSNNCVLGTLASRFLSSGSNNVSIGGSALTNNTGGSNNTAVGSGAGSSYNGSESSNISIGNNGVASESNVTRIGTQGSSSGQQNKCFIAGIFGTTTSDVGSTTAVLIDNTGNLGTIASSLRYKENVEDLGGSSILELRPVVFNYKSDLSQTTQYGLIAEEVHDIMPNLVVYDREGNPDSVKYHELPIFLLEEIKKLRQELNELKRTMN